METVIISNRALAYMISGIEMFPDKENGGLLIGIEKKEKTYIIEAIEAGAHSVHEKGRLFLNMDGIEHSLNTIINLYNEEISIMGIWHNHNNDYNPPFSSEDKICHRDLSNQLQRDIISILFQKKQDDEYEMRVFRYCNKDHKLTEEGFEIEELSKMISYRVSV